MVRMSIEQRDATNMCGNRPAPHPNQSLILPKRAMRDKRFADRIACISTDFSKKISFQRELTENYRDESNKDTGFTQENINRITGRFSGTLGNSRLGTGIYYLVFVASRQ